MTKRRARKGSVVTLMDPRFRRNPAVRPVVLQYGPQHLIDVLVAAPRGPPQNTFLHRADLPQRAVRAAVLQQHPRLETMRADRAEHKRTDQPRRFDEDSGAADRWGECPF